MGAGKGSLGVEGAVQVEPSSLVNEIVDQCDMVPFAKAKDPTTPEFVGGNAGKTPVVQV